MAVIINITVRRLHGGGVNSSGLQSSPISVTVSKLGAQGATGPQGPAGTVGSLRTVSTANITGTDVNITAVPGKTYYLPVGTLTQNRNIDLTALNTEGDYVEIINNEVVYNWNLTGQSVYYADGFSTVGTLFANTNYMIRLINGKLRILN